MMTYLVEAYVTRLEEPHRGQLATAARAVAQLTSLLRYVGSMFVPGLGLHWEGWMWGKKAWVLVVVCATTALLTPASALAVTGAVDGNDLVLVGGPEANNVDIDGTDSNIYYIQDSAGVTAGPGCTVATDVPNTLHCGDSSTVNIKVSLGGGDDSIDDFFLYGMIIWHHPLDQFLIDTGEGNNNVTLWEDDATDRGIITGDGNNIIKLAAAGAGGQNTVGVGDGNNTVDLAGGTNEVALGNGDNTVNGGNGQDTVIGGRGHNVINEGSSCGPNDCGVGATTIEAVDGGADQITCGLGANVVYADQFDTLSSGCTNVHHVKVGTGRATATPTVSGYAPVCRQKSGRKVCTPPTALRNHQYRGRTSTGQSITLSTDRHGKYVAIKPITVRFLCPGGDGEHAVSIADLQGFSLGDRQPISRNGTFFTEDDVDPGDGFSQEKIYFAGAFDGRKARGAIVGNTLYQGEQCSSGSISWSATG